MNSRAVVLRERAVRDVELAVDWYRRNGGELVALRFVDGFEKTLERISRDPHAGSPRFAQELDIAGLRTMRVSGFSYLVFYVEAAVHIDVWRVLHGARDLPALFQDDR